MRYVYDIGGQELREDKLDHVRELVPDKIRDPNPGERISDLDETEGAVVELRPNGLTVLATADGPEEFKFLNSLNCPKQWAIIKKEVI